MISRRKLIRIAAPAIIGIAAVPKLARAMQLPMQGWSGSPFAYPTDRPVGFNADHVAASKTLFSGVGMPNGQFMRLYPSVATGTQNLVTTSTLDGNIGPSPSITNSNGYISFPNFTTAQLTNYTLAAIVRFTTFTANPQRIIDTSASVAVGISWNSTGQSTVGAAGWALQNGVAGGSNLIFTGIAALNVPYFFAMSGAYVGSGSVSYVAAVLVNLLTGQTYTYVISNQILTLVTGDGNIYLGNRGANARVLGGLIAAAMFSNSTMSLSALQQWAISPWDYWYPPSMLMATLNGKTAAGGTSHLLPLLGVGK